MLDWCKLPLDEGKGKIRTKDGLIKLINFIYSAFYFNVELLWGLVKLVKNMQTKKTENSQLRTKRAQTLTLTTDMTV